MTVHEQIGSPFAPTHHFFHLVEGGWGVAEVSRGDVVEFDHLVCRVIEVAYLLEPWTRGQQAGVFMASLAGLVEVHDGGEEV